MDTAEHEYTDVQEWIKQGQVLTGQELFIEAESYFNRALSADPMNYTAYMSRGIMWASCGELDKAKADFSRAIKVNREIPDAYYHLGNIAFMQDDFQEGVKQFNIALAKGYDDAELYFHLGMVYEERQEYETAIRYYTKAIHKEELNPEFRIRKVIAQTKAERWEEAIETLDALYLVVPDSFEYYHLKALVYISMNRLDDADKLLTEANERFPDDIDLLNDRISVLVSKGDTEKALAYIEQIKPHMDDDAGLQKLLVSEGKLYAAQGKMDKAINSLEKAASLDAVPVHSTEALFLLINIHHAEEQFEKMVAVAEKMLKYQNVNSYAMSGWYYVALGKKGRGDSDWEAYYRQIIKSYRTVALDDPARIDAYLYRAMAYKDIKEYAKALEMMDYLALLQPENADIHAIKAIIYTEMGRPKEAQAEKELARNGSSLLHLNG